MKRILTLGLMVVLVLALVLTLGCTCGSAQPAPPSTPTSMAQLTVFTESSAQVVHPDQAFTLRVKVENRSSVKAESVHVYLEPSATGYALAEQCNYPMEAIAPAGVKASMGDIFPGENKDLLIQCKATSKAATEPQTVIYRVFHDFYGLGGRIEDSSISMSFSTGGMPLAPAE